MSLLLAAGSSYAVKSLSLSELLAVESVARTPSCETPAEVAILTWQRYSTNQTPIGITIEREPGLYQVVLVGEDCESLLVLVVSAVHLVGSSGNPCGAFIVE